MRRLTVLASMLMLLGLASIPAGAGPPGAECQISDDWTVNCGNGMFLDLHREGWADEHPGGLTFHITMTWTNAAGDTWTLPWTETMWEVDRACSYERCGRWW